MRTRANFGVIGTTQTQSPTSKGRIYSADDQKLAQQNGNWPSAYGAAFNISPAVSGKTSWNTAIDGALNIGTQGTYTITPTNNFTATITMWGAGGGAGTQNGSGGGGGYTTGKLAMSAGTSYLVRVGQGGRAGGGGTAGGGGGSGDTNRGGGGGYTGIFVTSETQGNARMIAGAGGGAGGDANNVASFEQGGAGGGTNGEQGNPTAASAHPGGGTQSAGGAGTGAGSSASGTALTGANGLSGGGGGYFGGASGGDNGAYAPGGGGGSGYLHGSVTDGVTTTGSGLTPAQSANALRGTAGSPRTGSAGVGNDGRFYLTV